MKEYVTVKNELVFANEIETENQYAGIIIVEDCKHERHVVKRKKRLKIDAPQLRYGRSLRVTTPEGETIKYATIRQAMELLKITREDIQRYSKTPAKSGKWFGWKFEKLG